MFSGLGSVLAAGASDLLGSAVSAYANHREAKLNREWQEKMFKNRYQYTVADLEAAGLNPALAYGNLASGTPSGSQAAGLNSSFGNTAKAAMQLQEQQAKKSEEVADSQIAVNVASANEINARAEKVRKETTQIPTLSQAEVDNIAKGQNSTYISQAIRDVHGWMLGLDKLNDSPEEIAERRLNDELNRLVHSGKTLPSPEERARMAREIAQKVREARGETKQNALKKYSEGGPSSFPSSRGVW